MRTIKFRGQRIDSKEWVYGYYYMHGVAAYIGVPIEDRPLKWLQVIPETIGQYTGLNDKNGVEIYEGDVIIYQSDAIRKVVYKNAAFHSVTLEEKHGDPNHPLYFTTLAPAGTSEIEIIGNIHTKQQ